MVGTRIHYFLSPSLSLSTRCKLSDQVLTQFSAETFQDKLAGDNINSVSAPIDESKAMLTYGWILMFCLSDLSHQLSPILNLSGELFSVTPPGPACWWPNSLLLCALGFGRLMMCVKGSGRQCSRNRNDITSYNSRLRHSPHSRNIYK